MEVTLARFSLVAHCLHSFTCFRCRCTRFATHFVVAVPAALRATRQAHMEPDVQSRNLVVTINGTEKPDEFVVIGGAFAFAGLI